jgi:hypothetical protein
LAVVETEKASAMINATTVVTIVNKRAPITQSNVCFAMETETPHSPHFGWG